MAAEEFATELLRKLRQKVTSAAPLKDIYIATGLYYRVLLGLNDFKPGSMILEILSIQIYPLLAFLHDELYNLEWVGLRRIDYSNAISDIQSFPMLSFFPESTTRKRGQKNSRVAQQLPTHPLTPIFASNNSTLFMNSKDYRPWG